MALATEMNLYKEYIKEIEGYESEVTSKRQTQ